MQLLLLFALFSPVTFADRATVPPGCQDSRVDKTLGVVHAHRGMGHGAGENTIAAFRRALEVGADVLELDLQVTKDLQLVVSHDAEVPEHCKLQGEPLLSRHIDALTVAQLKRFDCGPVDPARSFFAGDHGIPTFHEFLAAAALSKAHFNIEMKANAQIPKKGADFARLVMAELRHSGLIERSIVQSFDLAYLDAVRAEASVEEKAKLRLSLLMGFTYLASNWAKLAKKHELQILSPSVDKLPFWRSTVDSVHAVGVKIVPYSPDTEDQWSKYLAMGVDGLITNRPAELIKFLKADPRWRCLTNAP